MKVSVYAGTLEHQKAHAGPMAEGLRRHGCDVEMFLDGEPTGDAVVVWGWRRGREHLGKRPVLVMERGYLGDRFRWCSLGWDGLNGRARFPDAQDAGERFARHFGALMQPWARREGYALIIGQVPGDMSLEPAGGRLGAWYRDVAGRLDGDVRYRPHPGVLQRGLDDEPPGVSMVGGTLADALAGARVVVTFNSNAGVEAVLAGVPTIATDQGSMAWPMTAHGLDEPLVTPDRAAWAARLAWCQWNENEIRSGEAWEAVKEVM